MTVDTIVNLRRKDIKLDEDVTYFIDALKSLENRYKEVENKYISSIKIVVEVRNYEILNQRVDVIIKFYRHTWSGEDFLYITTEMNRTVLCLMTNIGHWQYGKVCAMPLIDYHTLKDMIDIFESWLESERSRKRG